MKRKSSTIKESPKAESKKAETPKKKETSDVPSPATKKAKKETSKTIEKFEDLNLVESLSALLTSNSITTPSEIQKQVLAPALAGDDLNVVVKPDADIALCLLLPALELLLKSKKDEALGVFIISANPQIAKLVGIFEPLLKENNVTVCTNSKSIKGRLELLNTKKYLLIGFPKNIFHLATKALVDVDSVKLVIVDDLTARLSQNTCKARQLFFAIPKKRQTIFFSATQNETSKQISKLALSPTNVLINTTGEALPDVAAPSPATSSPVSVNGLQLFQTVVPGEVHFAFLHSFLKKNATKKNKVIVSFELKENLEYFAKLNATFGGLTVQSDVADTSAGLSAFLNEKSGILLSLQVQKKKGDLDLSKVDWLIYFDIPTTAQQFASELKANATTKAAGKAILVLLNVEDYLTTIENAIKVRPAQLDFAVDSLFNYEFNQKVYEAKEKDHALVELGNKAIVEYKRYLSKLVKDAAYTSHYKSVSDGVILNFFGFTQGIKTANISEKEFKEKVAALRKTQMEILSLEQELESSDYSKLLKSYCFKNKLGNPRYKFAAGKKQCAVTLKKNGKVEYFNGKLLTTTKLACLHAAKVALEALQGANPNGDTQKPKNDTETPKKDEKNDNNKTSDASPNKKRKRKSKN